MTLLNVALRSVAAAALLLVTSGGLLISAMLVTTAGERIAKDRRYLACFKAAAMRAPPLAGDCPLISPDTGIDEDGFRVRVGPPPPGGVVFSFWRGEWVEYYASWSGETTLLASPARYWAAFAPQVATWLLITGLAATGAWFAKPSRARG